MSLPTTGSVQMEQCTLSGSNVFLAVISNLVQTTWLSEASRKRVYSLPTSIQLPLTFVGVGLPPVEAGATIFTPRKRHSQLLKAHVSGLKLLASEMGAHR